MGMNEIIMECSRGSELKCPNKRAVPNLEISILQTNIFTSQPKLATAM
jgi:hypothetical protein